MSSYQIRKLCRGDLTFAQEVRRIAGWNQTDADWARLLDVGEDGCFLLQCDGQPAATATTTVYSKHLAWIGMILVHPSFRGRGLATAMMRHCLDHLLDQRGVSCVRLDATPTGQTLYGKIGFQIDYVLNRWTGPAPLRRDDSTETNTVEQLALTDSERWLALDRSAFGVDRSTFLRRLARDSRRAVQYSGRCCSCGYGMLRSGAEATYLGPVVASNPTIARAVVRDLLQTPRSSPNSADRTIYWDIPVANRAAEQLAQQLGFTRQRPLIRMWTGSERQSDDPKRQWAIAGPETG